MLDFLEARRLAELQLPTLRAKFQTDDIILIDKYSKATSRGWIFIYNTQKSQQTCLPQDGLVGNGPILVDKYREDVFLLPSGGWKQLLAQYEETGSTDRLDGLGIKATRL